MEEPTYGNLSEELLPDQEYKKLREELLRSKQELQSLHQEKKEHLAERERELHALFSCHFCFTNLQKDSDINVYTVLPNLATFMAIFEFLDPGESCENIWPREKHLTDVPEDFYCSESSNDEEDTDNTPSAKRGHLRKIRPLDELFIIMCRLRRGFSEGHLTNLYSVAQSTISLAECLCLGLIICI